MSSSSRSAIKTQTADTGFYKGMFSRVYESKQPARQLEQRGLQHNPTVQQTSERRRWQVQRSWKKSPWQQEAKPGTGAAAGPET